MIYRRCPSPEHPSNTDRFYEKKLGSCPACGSAPVLNQALVSAKLNGFLTSQVSRQHDEVAFARRARTEREPN